MSSMFGVLFFIASLVMAKYGIVLSVAYIIATVLCVVQWESLYGKKEEKDEKGDIER